MPYLLFRKFANLALRVCNHGTLCLKAFARATMITVALQLWLGFVWLPQGWMIWLNSVILCTLCLALLFWNGMLCVYLSSLQLGVKHRAVGLLLGMIPIANMIMLEKIIRITEEEVRFETEKLRINHDREADQICKTKYPILLVHGVFFRDNRYLNYWGRIPKELIQNGASIYYGEHPSALSIADSAAILAKRITAIVNDTGCEKVNIIAHSKGGLDCRYAMAHLGIAPLVASLTTVSSPHRGCVFADRLLEKIPARIQRKVAHTYNAALKEFGDPEPDFMAAVRDLTSSHCVPFDAETALPDGVYCQSVGSKLNYASSGKFPLNMAYHLVKHYDGENDGLVGLDSFAWGQRYQLLTTAGKRGISHADMIDMNRENIIGFDVREFYVQLVSDLKQKGL
ncbi:MAG: triacylglycerol lipase [Oscillospiraceae bacterium]|nr:triacylglycerol lipase [Oscillospiraceae bacterium]